MCTVQFSMNDSIQQTQFISNELIHFEIPFYCLLQLLKAILLVTIIRTQWNGKTFGFLNQCNAQL